MKDSIKREQRQAGLHFAERENSRATLKRKLLLMFALLCTVALGAWAQANWDQVYAMTQTTSGDWTAFTAAYDAFDDAYAQAPPAPEASTASTTGTNNIA